MSQAVDLTKDIEKARRTPETEKARKKQEKPSVTFS
jgi:hypothetical protein